MIFHPCARIEQAVYASMSLQTSAEISSNFTPLERDSPSFKSQRTYSRSGPSRGVGINQQYAHGKVPHVDFLTPCKFGRPLAHARIELLNPYFGANQVKDPRTIAEDARIPERTRATHTTRRSHISSISANVSATQTLTTTTVHGNPHPRSDNKPTYSHSASSQNTSPTPVHFPPSGFGRSLALFSGSFSSFPHNAYLLSISHPCLTLSKVCHPVKTTFPGGPAHQRHLIIQRNPNAAKLSPSTTPPSEKLIPNPSLEALLRAAVQAPHNTEFSD